MAPLHQQHQAYTLRLSRVTESDEWRVALYCAQTGQRHHFLGLAQMYTFLLQATSDPEPDRDSSYVPSDPK